MIRVILADDHTIIRDGLRSILEKQSDIEVIADVADGQQAVAACLTHKPDIVLMDIHMPPFNGVDATRHIREENLRIEVIILSMHANKETIYQALKAGAKGYLVKETTSLEVVDAIRMVHAGNRYLSTSITATVIDDYIKRRSLEHQKEPIERLSNRERTVLQLVVEGRTSKEIADLLSLSPNTVNTYRSRLMKKLELKDYPALVRFAIDHQLLPAETDFPSGERP